MRDSNPQDATKPASHMLIIHEIEAWERWKTIFDGAAAMRQAAGEIEYRLLAYQGEPLKIVHFSRWSSHAAARAFFESPELVEIRRVAGVRAPDFIYLNEIEAGILLPPTGG